MDDTPAPFVPRVNLDALHLLRRPPSGLVDNAMRFGVGGRGNGSNAPSPTRSTGQLEFPSSPWGSVPASSKFLPDFFPGPVPPASPPGGGGGGDMIDALMEQQQQHASHQHSVSPLPPPMRLRGGAAVHSATNGSASRSRFAALGAHQFDASHRRPFNPSDTADGGHNVDGATFCSPDAPLLASRRLGGGLVNRPSGGGGGSPPTAHTIPTSSSSSRFSPQSGFHSAANNGGSNLEGFGAPLPPRALPGNHRSLQLSSASSSFSSSSSSSSSSQQAASFGATSMTMTDSPVAAMRSLSIAARERGM